MDRQAVSTLLGFASICAWLCAQVPQLVENWRNGSVEGLALPFLVSWLFGDVTNLVGCLLTRQLPFQTYLASYFVLVDVGLMSQWIYYSNLNPAPILPPLSATHPHLYSHPHTPRNSYMRSSKDREASRQQSSSTKTNRKPSRVASNPKRSASREGGALRRSTFEADQILTRSWMSEVDRSSSRPPLPPISTSSSHHFPSAMRNPSQPSSAHLSSYASSAHPSEAQDTPPMSIVPLPSNEPRGRTLARPHFSAVLDTISGSPANAPSFLQHQQQQPQNLHQRERIDDAIPAGLNGLTRSASRQRTARKSSSMVFLSVGLLFGFSRWSTTSDVTMPKAWTTDDTVRSRSADTGFGRHILQYPVIFRSSSSSSSSSSAVSNAAPILARRQIFPLSLSIAPSSTFPRSDLVSPSTTLSIDSSTAKDDTDEQPEYPEGPDYERILGRASAWLCTTLYLTSRMPQLWKNFRRRSVEGLSMLLFTMAFVGNSLYVLSILTNPLAATPGYLLESIPYLLGSGGTLCFDFAIVFQSFLYSDKRKERLERDRRRLGKSYVDAEEAAALLRSGSGRRRTTSRGTAGDECYDAEDHDEDDGTTATEGTATEPHSRNASRNPSRSVSLSGRRSSTIRTPTTTRALLPRSSSTELGGMVTPTYSESDDERATTGLAFDFDLESRSRSRTRVRPLSMHAVAEESETASVSK